MKKQNYGKIINIASIAGFVTFEGMAVTAYCASKGGVVNFTRALSSELGGNGITCLLYTSDAADERSSVDLGGRRIIKKKKKQKKKKTNRDTETTQRSKNLLYR